MHLLPIGVAVLLFVAALAVTSWGSAVLLFHGGSSIAFLLGIRHEEDGAAGAGLALRWKRHDVRLERSNGEPGDR